VPFGMAEITKRSPPGDDKLLGVVPGGNMTRLTIALAMLLSSSAALAETQAEIREAGLPQILGDRLSAGA